MLNEDHYMERTPDLVAKVRAMREAAQKEMNRFTHVSDYDARCVVGHGPKPAPISSDTVTASPASERPRKSTTKSAPTQVALEFAPAPAEPSDDGGKA